MSISQFATDWESVASEEVPHEECFGYLSQVSLGEPAIVIDIGANSGISALSVHFVQPSWPIISYEPNSELEPLLRRTQEFIRNRGGQMDYRLAGLADVNDDSLTFRIPVVDTTYQDVLSMGSFAADEFDKGHIKSLLGDNFMQSGTWTGELRELRLPVRRFDDEPRPPGTFYFVKVDVEGFELQVLEGMMIFIKEARPALLVEMGSYASFVEMERRLEGLGYRAYWYDHLTDQLLPSPIHADVDKLLVARALGPMGRRGYEARVASIAVRETHNVYFIADGSPFLPHGAAGTGVSRFDAMKAKRLRREAEAKAAKQSEELRHLHAERLDLYKQRQVLYDERQALYDERQMLVEQVQKLQRGVGERERELERGLQAQSALVTAQELALRGYANDHERLCHIEAAQQQIEQTLTWRAHQYAVHFRLVQFVARSTRRTAKWLGR